MDNKIIWLQTYDVCRTCLASAHCVFTMPSNSVGNSGSSAANKSASLTKRNFENLSENIVNE